jgi:hypothetical protein
VKGVGLGAASAAAQSFVTHPQSSHNPINLAFLLDPLSKSEFLSFILSFFLSFQTTKVGEKSLRNWSFKLLNND